MPDRRRAFLRRLAAFLAVGAAAGSAIDEEARARESRGAVCVNPGALSAVESRQRLLDNYTEKSSDPARTCSACRFFTPGARGAACGRCEIFNGPANARGHCDDWTARPS